MRAVLAVLLLAFLVAGCGGGGQASTAGGPTSAPALEPTLAAGLAAFEQAVAADATPAGPVLSDELRADGLEMVARLAADQPTATYPSARAPDGDWTARELLEWIAANARPQTARAAQEALGALP